ncbi:MAG: DUF2461 domain-containing protein [Sphingobacterium sp.]
MKIEKSTFDFLDDLKRNNDRDWFNEHRDRYEAALGNVMQFIEYIIDRISDVDPHINRDISAKKCLFRIYRDVRFSKNKEPYKSWFAAGISIDGRKLEGPEYYIHLGPEESYVAVGYWRPSKPHLDAIRQEIDYNAPDLMEALMKGGWSAANLSKYDQLKRPPAGYTQDHEHIDLMKHRSFILNKKFSREQMESDRALDSVIEAYDTMIPFKLFLHRAIDQ